MPQERAILIIKLETEINKHHFRLCLKFLETHFCQHIPEMVNSQCFFLFSLCTMQRNVCNRRIKYFLSSFRKKILILGLCYILMLANSFWLLLNYSFSIIICNSASSERRGNFALGTGHTTIDTLDYSPLAFSTHTHTLQLKGNARILSFFQLGHSVNY